jgi:hypothetical protein
MIPLFLPISEKNDFVLNKKLKMPDEGKPIIVKLTGLYFLTKYQE